MAGFFDYLEAFANNPQIAAGADMMQGIDPNARVFNAQQAALQQAKLQEMQRAQQESAAVSDILRQTGGQITPESIAAIARVSPTTAFEMQNMLLKQQQQEMMMQMAQSQDPNVLRALGIATGNTAAVTAAGQLQPDYVYSEQDRRWVDRRAPYGAVQPPVNPPLEPFPELLEGGDQGVGKQSSPAGTVPTLENPLAGVDTVGLTPAEIAQIKLKNIEMLTKAQQEKSTAQKEEAIGFDSALYLLGEAEKILPQASSGGLQRGMTAVGEFMGQASPSSEVDAQLQTFAARLKTLNPKSLGANPTDKDLEILDQANASLGNAFLPAETRLATARKAQQVIKKLSASKGIKNKDIGSMSTDELLQQYNRLKGGM